MRDKNHTTHNKKQTYQIIIFEKCKFCKWTFFWLPSFTNIFRRKTPHFRAKTWDFFWDLVESSNVPCFKYWFASIIIEHDGSWKCGAVPFFSLYISLANTWEFLWLTVTDLFQNNNSLNDKSSVHRLEMAWTIF